MTPRVWDLLRMLPPCCARRLPLWGTPAARARAHRLLRELNTRRRPLGDARVRRAINHAVNVPQILATVWGGRGIRARGAIPPTLPGGDTTRPAYAYDPPLARRLLAEAGYGDRGCARSPCWPG